MQVGHEVKFQVWDQDAKQMWTWEDIDAADKKGILRFLDMLVQDQFIPRRFTGLRDKHGCEIYEGDHMYASGNLYGEEYIGTVVWDKDDARFEVVGLHGRFEYIPDECYVKGNIYENPELLEVGK